MIVRLKLFAVARQLAGSDTLELEVADQAIIADVRRALAERVPALAPLAGHLLFSINQEYAPETMVVPAGAEVACIPPVSGG